MIIGIVIIAWMIACAIYESSDSPADDPNCRGGHDF